MEREKEQHLIKCGWVRFGDGWKKWGNKVMPAFDDTRALKINEIMLDVEEQNTYAQKLKSGNAQKLKSGNVHVGNFKQKGRI